MAGVGVGGGAGEGAGESEMVGHARCVNTVPCCEHTACAQKERGAGWRARGREGSGEQGGGWMYVCNAHECVRDVCVRGAGDWWGTAGRGERGRAVGCAVCAQCVRGSHEGSGGRRG
jgi:hypothetical protein